MKGAFRFTAVVALAASGAMRLHAGDRKVPVGESSNENVAISGEVIIGREQIRQALGVSALPPNLAGLIVVKMKLRSVSDKAVSIDRDAFTLLSDRDGQRSQPLAPSQLAGNEALVIAPGPSQGGGAAMGDGGGPAWGGFGGMSMGGIGMGGGSTETVTAKAKQGGGNKLLLEALKAKILPEKKVDSSVSGLLYFQIDGKVKPKNLTLFYKGDGGNLEMRFRP